MKRENESKEKFKYFALALSFLEENILTGKTINKTRCRVRNLNFN
jgi:hypothetical protein